MEKVDSSMDERLRRNGRRRFCTTLRPPSGRGKLVNGARPSRHAQCAPPCGTIGHMEWPRNRSSNNHPKPHNNNHNGNEDPSKPTDLPAAPHLDVSSATVSSTPDLHFVLQHEVLGTADDNKRKTTSQPPKTFIAINTAVGTTLLWTGHAA